MALIGDGPADSGREGLDQLQNRVTSARSQVEGKLAHVTGGQRIKCSDVSLGQIHHVDVVAHAGAIGSGVVVAKHTDVVALPCSSLRDVGRQVVRHPARQLADQPTGMGPHRVEVAQDSR
ncbi:hypothetical protein D3C81_1765770 [compost metagenome]